jgi:hypothetical protein
MVPRVSKASTALLLWLLIGGLPSSSLPESDPPGAVIGATARVRFDAATPSHARTLEQQVRAGLDELRKRDRRATILKLRVFAVGADHLVDARRTIVDVFRAARLPMPAIALAGVAAFPDASQQVQIESVSSSPTELNPNGVAFLAGLASPAGDRTVNGLARIAREGGVRSEDVTRVSCFYEDPGQVAAARTAIGATFPSARSSFVRSYAAAAAPAIECEAVGRLAEPVTDHGVRYFNLPGTPPSPFYSRAAFVSAPSLVFTATHVARGEGAPDLREMFEQAKGAAAPLGAELRDVVMADNYWLTPGARDRLREVRAQYFAGTVPAASGVFFTGVESPTGTAAMDLVLAVRAPGSAPR